MKKSLIVLILHGLATHFGFLLEWSNQKFGLDKKLNLHIPSNLRCYASQYLHVIQILHKFCFIQKESGIWIEIFACKSSNILAKFPFVFSYATSSTLYIHLSVIHSVTGHEKSLELALLPGLRA